MAELFEGALHCFDRSARERLGHVTDSASNQPLGCFRIGFAKFAHSARDFRKQIAGLKLEIIFVEIRHRCSGVCVKRRT
jgi:hypothetical protein